MFARWARLLLGVGALAVATAAPAQEAASLEYQVKAVFLLRIAQFTEWPADSEQLAQPFVIGVLGQDPFGSILEQAVAGERISGRPIVVRRYVGLAELAPCDLLFVAASHQHATAQVLSRLKGTQTLTVADFAGFVGRGGAVELFLDQDRVRFRIDRDAAQRAGVVLRSQLLRAAASVEET
ncbi:MAG: YfiR family protein [Pseudomonadota bacterium]|nr:YfiR family protein [Pseudomonadota bacterium]